MSVMLCCVCHVVLCLPCYVVSAVLCCVCRVMLCLSRCVVSVVQCCVRPVGLCLLCYVVSVMLYLLSCLCYKFPESNEKVQLVPDIVKALTELFMVMESFGKVSQCILLGMLHVFCEILKELGLRMYLYGVTSHLCFSSSWFPFATHIFPSTYHYVQVHVCILYCMQLDSLIHKVLSLWQYFCADCDRLSVTEHTKLFVCLE